MTMERLATRDFMNASPDLQQDTTRY